MQDPDRRASHQRTRLPIDANPGTVDGEGLWTTVTMTHFI
jgi:hypothetical protein